MPASPFFTDPAMAQGFSNLAQIFAPQQIDPVAVARAADFQSQADERQFQQDALINFQRALTGGYGDVYAPDGSVNQGALGNIIGFGARAGIDPGMINEIAPHLALNLLQSNPAFAEDIGRAAMIGHGNALNEDTAAFTARADDVARRNANYAMAIDNNSAAATARNNIVDVFLDGTAVPMREADRLAQGAPLVSSYDTFADNARAESQLDLNMRAEDRMQGADARSAEAHRRSMGEAFNSFTPDDLYPVLDMLTGRVVDDQGAVVSGPDIAPGVEGYILQRASEIGATQNGATAVSAVEQAFNEVAEWDRTMGRIVLRPEAVADRQGGQNIIRDDAVSDARADQRQAAREGGGISDVFSAPQPTPSQGGAAQPALPPVNERVVGETTIETPQGVFVWTGNGWTPQQRSF